MSIFRNIKSRAAIIRTAANHNQEPAQVRADIQEAIAEAWASEDPAAKALQAKLFPNGQPSPEEFIAVISSTLKFKSN